MNITIDIPKSYRMLLPAKFHVNRDEEVNFIVNTLKPDPGNSVAGKQCFLQGSQGIGKTELCRAAALRMRNQYSDAQIYLQVDENDDEHLSMFKIFEALIHIIDPYTRLSDDLETLRNQYHTILEGKRILIVVDGLQHGGYLDLLTPPASCGLLITSKVPLAPNNQDVIKLKELAPEKAEELLLDISPRVGKSATHLAKICRNIPANLYFVAGYLNYRQAVEVDDFVGELKKHVTQSLTDKSDPSEVILSYIVKQLTVEEQNLLFQLGILSSGFRSELAEKLGSGNVDSDAVYAYMDIFTQLNLLIFDKTTDHYYLQSGIHNFALKELKNVPEAWLRLGKTYSESMDWYNSLADRSSDTFLLSLLILDEHKSNMREILRYLSKHPSPEGDQVLLGFLDLIRLYGSTRFSLKLERLPFLEAMMNAASRLHDSILLPTILEALSNIYQTLGEKEKSLHYLELHDKAINNNMVTSMESALKDTSQSETVEPQILVGEDEMRSESIPLALEKLSINEAKVVLTGFMGTGKTTVGKLLSEYLNYRFVDTDELIESRYDLSISDIFKELGEDSFREMERTVVRELADVDGIVISTGGRLMLDPENVKALSRNSRVLCLVATPDEILTRVEQDNAHKRPLLTVLNPKERIVDLLQERNEQYLRFPQVITDEKQPVDIARSLAEFVNTSPRSLVVANPQKSYEYIVGAGLLPFLRQLTGVQEKIVVITDREVKGLYGPSCASIGNFIIIPSGRKNKSIATVQYVYNQLLDMGFDRSGTIIALGGNIVGDIAGYVAATYMRGVDLIQCPTSLIAMVDSSVGGKASIDLPQGKNLIGVYKQPLKVIADVATLQTLPHPVFAAGMAEVVKHGLIAESSLLEQIEQGHWAKNWDRSPSYIGELQKLVAQAIQIKINIVQADPFELGQRSILNLGHTFAYALERVSDNTFRHGEAVSMGLVAAADLSVRLGLCDVSLQKRIEAILESVNLPTRIPSYIQPDALFQAMQHDKKKRAGQLRFILLRGIGQVFVSDEVSAEEIKETIFAMTG